MGRGALGPEAGRPVLLQVPGRVPAVSELSGEAQTHGEPCRARPIQMLEISPPQ